MTESEWKVIPGHHEPLVSEETFRKVNSGQPGRSTKRKREKPPLVGVIYCGGCGYSMSYKPASKYKRFECRKHSVLQIESCCTNFNADLLEEIVLNRLCRELLHRGNAMKDGRSLEEYQKSAMENIKSRMKEYRIKCDSMQREKDTLYERYFEKKITAEESRSKSDGLMEQKNSLTEQLDTLQLQYQKIEEEYDRYNKSMKQIVRFAHMEELTQEAVDIFIKRIYTYKDKRVEIEWNFAERSSVI